MRPYGGVGVTGEYGVGVGGGKRSGKAEREEQMGVWKFS